MERGYDQLSLEEWRAITRRCDVGKSMRQITAPLDRAPLTIAREIKRNSGMQVGYRPSYAKQQSNAAVGGKRLLASLGLASPRSQCELV